MNVKENMQSCCVSSLSIEFFRHSSRAGKLGKVGKFANSAWVLENSNVSKVGWLHYVLAKMKSTLF